MTTNIAQAEQQPILDFLNHFSGKLRAGYRINQILEDSDQELSGPLAGQIKKVHEEIRAGTSLQDALDRWLTRTPGEALNLMIATIKVQFEQGGNLADKLDLIGQVIAKRKEL
jgi:tight adherence protein B